MTEKNQPGPENADRCQDQKAIATEPAHARIIPLLPDFKISFQRLCTAVKSLPHLTLGALKVRTIDLEVVNSA